MERLISIQKAFIVNSLYDFLIHVRFGDFMSFQNVIIPLP